MPFSLSSPAPAPAFLSGQDAYTRFHSGLIIFLCSNVAVLIGNSRVRRRGEQKRRKLLKESLPILISRSCLHGGKWAWSRGRRQRVTAKGHKGVCVDRAGKGVTGTHE